MSITILLKIRNNSLISYLRKNNLIRWHFPKQQKQNTKTHIPINNKLIKLNIYLKNILIYIYTYNKKGISYNNFIMNTNRAVPPQGKVAYYRSDGTGRDTYIRQHNGGLLSKDRLHSLCQFKPPKQKNLVFGKTQYNRHPTSYKFGGSNKFPHYISDGSGRDFYVKNTQGGNSHPFRWRDQTDYLFKSTLRNHSEYPNTNPQNQDVFMKSQMRSTMRQTNFRNTLGPIQRQLDTKLAQPKRVHLPPPVHTYFQNNFNSTRGSRICEADYRKRGHSIDEKCIHKNRCC